MIEELIPDDIRQFILSSIDSIAQLEALLLLRAHPLEKWNIAAVAKRLYITEQETLPLLTHLCEQGLLVPSDPKSTEYAYQPQSDQLTQLVDSLAELYTKHLVPVTNLIHSKPRTRIQEFAEAFRLRKDE